MGVFDDIGHAFDDAGKAIGGAVEDAGEAVGHAVEDAEKAVVGAVSDAAGAIAGAVEKGAPGAIAGAVLGTILFGPIGGVIGGAAGGVIAQTPVGEEIGKDVGEVVDTVKDQVHFDDELENFFKGLRGAPPEEKNTRRDTIPVGPGDNDPNAKTALKPGEDTPVVVAVATLRPNSNVLAIKATLVIADATAVPPPETTIANVDSTASAQADKVAITVDTPKRPRNITIKLDGGAPFFTHAAPLTDSAYPIPDFAAAVNDYLDRAQVAEPVPLKFIVKSDTPGLVGIMINPADVIATQLKTQTWTNVIDATIHLDRPLTLDFATTEEIALSPVAPAAGQSVSVVTLSFDVSGTMGPERLLGNVSAAPATTFATVSADYAVAQPTMPGAGIDCVGMSVRLFADAAARIYVALQTDAGGLPATAAPLASTDVALQPTPDGASGWTFIPFPAVGVVPAGARVWMILRGIQGSVRVALEPAGTTSSPTACVKRGGQFWQSLGTGSAVSTRLVYLPKPENASSSLEIQVTRTAGAPLATRRVDARAATQNISLPLPAGVGAAPLSLIVYSHARGAVNVANVVQEYATV